MQAFKTYVYTYITRQTQQADARQENKRMAKYTVRFQIECEEGLFNGLERDILDLLKVAVLPTLNLELVPLTFEVKKTRK